MEVIDGIYKGCKFKTFYDGEGFHVLDNNVENTKFKTVTDYIEDILIQIEKLFSVDVTEYSYLLIYGSDCMVAEYILGEYKYLEPSDERVDPMFLEAMIYMYY